MEYFADVANADFFAEAITDTDNLIVPTISLLNHGQAIEGIRICNPFIEADTA